MLGYWVWLESKYSTVTVAVYDRFNSSGLSWDEMRGRITTAEDSFVKAQHKHYKAQT